MVARQLLIAASATVLGIGCVATPPSPPAVRVSDLALRGDDAHRASQRLVIEGLEADERGDTARARGRYERALQIDASNPWVYLALARHNVESGDPRAALSYVDRAEALLEAQGQETPGAKVHCDGLRGAALELEGREYDLARQLLDSAARSAPTVWGDGELSAGELR